MSRSELPQAILALLDEHGPLTGIELTRLTGKDRRRVDDALKKMGKPLKRTPKRLYICEWVRDVEGSRKYLRPVYDIGEKPDAKKLPPISRKEIQRESGKRKRAKVKLNFVFNLGIGANRLLARAAS